MQNTSANSLVKDVIDWGRVHGITNAPMQFAKINEEIGELAHELVRGKTGDGKTTVPSPETIDAIGDILVTVIIFADIIGVDPISALQLSYDIIKDRKGETKDGQFIKENE